jgi:hypothetical protein
MSLDLFVKRIDSIWGPKSEREYDELQGVWNRILDEENIETLFVYRIHGVMHMYEYIDTRMLELGRLDPRLDLRLEQMRARLDATQKRLLMAHAGEKIQLRMLLGMNRDDMLLMPEVDAGLHPDAAEWLNGRRHWTLAQAYSPSASWRTLVRYMYDHCILNPLFHCGGPPDDTLLHRLMERNFPAADIAVFQPNFKDRWTAVGMGGHRRLGESTQLRHLDPDVLDRVMRMSVRP